MSLRVLIADDHAPTRSSIRAAVEADDRFTVCAEAADAAGAIQTGLAERPDVALLDITMPGGGGVAAAWEISARLPETRIVMLTVSDENRDVLAALRAGAVGYLLKDMDFERLPAALWDVAHGEATIPPTLLAEVLAQFRDPSAKWRSRVSEKEGPRLTSREWEILELHQQGLSTAQIARRLSLTPATVRSHRARLVRKLSEAEEGRPSDSASQRSTRDMSL